MDEPQLSGYEEATSRLIVELSQTVGALFAAGSLEDTFVQVADLAVATIEACEFSSILVAGPGGHVLSVVQTDPVVGGLDAVQAHGGGGPSVAAITGGVAVYAGSLPDEGRWPHLREEALALDIRCLLALPLAVGGTAGVLNAYARPAGAFGVVDRATGLLLATAAGAALSSARTRRDDERDVAHLHIALASRGMIGQAQGILMERERVTADQAFDNLRRASQHLNVKLRDVAQTLIDTGEDPITGPSKTQESNEE